MTHITKIGKMTTELYVWGNDSMGQLGLGHRYIKKDSEKKCSSLQKLAHSISRSTKFHVVRISHFF